MAGPRLLMIDEPFLWATSGSGLEIQHSVQAISAWLGRSLVSKCVNSRPDPPSVAIKLIRPELAREARLSRVKPKAIEATFNYFARWILRDQRDGAIK